MALNGDEYAAVQDLAIELRRANPFEDKRSPQVPNVYITIAMKLVMDGWRKVPNPT